MSPLSDVMLDIKQTNNVSMSQCRLKYNFQSVLTCPALVAGPRQSNILEAWPDSNRVLQHQMKALLLSYSFIASPGSGLALVKTGQ